MRWRLISSILLRRGDWREDVSAYMDDELSPRERARVEARLAESEEMREYLADLEDMRSVLRSFEPAHSAAPFQLTPEMLNSPTRVLAPPSSTARALRWSVSTAAVGVATFAAVMVFDAVDSPTVQFTTTSAGEQPSSVPTVAVVTEEIEIQDQSQPASDSSAAQQSGRPESAAAPTEEEAAEEAPRVTVLASGQEQEAVEAEVDQAQEESTQDSVDTQAADEAAADPSRRGLTAGRGGGTSDAQSVTAADVVAQDEAVESEAAEQAEVVSSQSADTTTSEPQDQVEATAETSAESDTSEQASVAESQSETRSVATSVSRVEADWPLEQRPRSSTVQLATDPDWERPVQIVLAAIAIGSTVFWLVLTIVDRRRRV